MFAYNKIVPHIPWYGDTMVYSDDNIYQYHIAGEEINAFTCVVLWNDRVYKFDPLMADHYNKLIGITTMRAIKDGQIQVVTAGKIVYYGWGLTPAKFYFASTNGQMSLLPPVGLCVFMGMSLTADIFYVNITM